MWGAVGAFGGYSTAVNRSKPPRSRQTGHGLGPRWANEGWPLTVHLASYMQRPNAHCAAAHACCLPSPEWSTGPTGWLVTAMGCPLCSCTSDRIPCMDGTTQLTTACPPPASPMHGREECLTRSAGVRKRRHCPALRRKPSPAPSSSPDPVALPTRPPCPPPKPHTPPDRAWLSGYAPSSWYAPTPMQALSTWDMWRPVAWVRGHQSIVTPPKKERLPQPSL